MRGLGDPSESLGRLSERGEGSRGQVRGRRGRGGCLVTGLCWRRSMDAQKDVKSLRGCVGINVNDEQSEVAGSQT